MIVKTDGSFAALVPSHEPVQDCMMAVLLDSIFGRSRPTGCSQQSADHNFTIFTD